MHDRELYQAILGLTKPWSVERVELDEERREVRVFVGWPAGEAVVCPVCGESCGVYDHRLRRWRHLDTCQYQTILVAEVPRSNCPADGVHQVAVAWAEADSRFTAMFEALVIDWMTEASLSAVSRQFDLSWDEAFGIQQRAVTRGLAARRAEVLEHVGVDEKSFQRRHEYVTVLCDLDGGRVWDVADERTGKSLAGMLDKLTDEQKAGIQAVAMDMWEPYVKAVSERIPLGRSKIVFDKFHVAKHLNDGVDQVRRQESAALADQGDRRLVGTKYDWLSNPANFSRGRWVEFGPLRDSKLKVARAWAMKETAMGLWDYRYPGAARRLFRRWFGWVARSRLRPMIAKAKLLKRHLENILTYLKHRITNAVSEGINSKIQWIKYTARGFTNRANFRTAILFHCGGLSLHPKMAHTIV